jgi:hypothetical protein
MQVNSLQMYACNKPLGWGVAMLFLAVYGSCHGRIADGCRALQIPIKLLSEAYVQPGFFFLGRDFRNLAENRFYR